jgi:hypothetical protein
MKRLFAAVLVTCIAVGVCVSLAGPPTPFHDPHLKITDAIDKATAHMKEEGIDLSKEQYISSAVLKHRDNSNDKTPKAMGHYWDIQWSMKPPDRKSPPKQKKLWHLEISMNGKVYEGS